MIDVNPGDAQSYYSPYRLLMLVYETKRDNMGLLRVWEKLSELYPNDPNVIANVQKYRNLSNPDGSKVDSVPELK